MSDGPDQGEEGNSGSDVDHDTDTQKTDTQKADTQKADTLKDAGAAPRTGEEPRPQDELFEAIDHVKSAASILFDRARKDPAVRSGLSEAERLAKRLSDATGPLARQLTDELGRMTKDIVKTVEGARRTKSSRPPAPAPTDNKE